MRYAKLSTVCVVFMMALTPLAVFVGNVAATAPVQITPLFPGGSGTPGDPYWIVNVSDLQNMSTDLNAHYELQNDIDASATFGWMAGFDPVGTDTAEFNGTLEGGGFEIGGLFIDRPLTDYTGLFGYLNAGARVNDTHLRSVDISGQNNVGGLAGYAKGDVTNCSGTDSVVQGSFYVGGLIGHTDGNVTNCHSTGNVSCTNNYVGGLVGRSFGTVTDCSAGGLVDGENDYVGGLVGSSSGHIIRCTTTGIIDGVHNWIGGLVASNTGTVDDCHTSVNVMGLGASPQQVGGLAGSNHGDITNSTAAGTVNSSWDYVGGFTGLNSGTISNCSSSATVNGTLANCDFYGGFIGRRVSGTIVDCYSTGDVNADNSVGGFIGDLQGTSPITNCHATGNVYNSGLAGGLIGRNIDGVGVAVSNCYATGNIIGGGNIGGLVGRTDLMFMDNCFSTGDVNGAPAGGLVGQFNGYMNDSWASGNVVGSSNIGGLVGTSSGFINRSYCTGNVGIATSDGCGGFAGQNTGGGTIIDCYSTGDVTGDSMIGGFIGWNSATTNRTYCSGKVTGNTEIGGYAGRNNNTFLGIINNSYWDNETSGRSDGIGDMAPDPAGIIGMNTTDMMLQATFANWTFGATPGSATWFNVDGETRPFLQTEHSTEIWNSHQLQLMTMDKTADYLLQDNIDLSDIQEPNQMWGAGPSQGKGFLPIGNGTDFFNGTFDRSHCVIDNLFINRSSEYYVALFGRIGPSARISNITLGNVNVTGYWFVSSLAAYNDGGVVVNCNSTGNVSGQEDVAGLVGHNRGLVDNCHSVGTVNGTSADIGGLIGWNLGGTVTNSTADAEIPGANIYAGGLIGYSSGQVTNCTAYGNTTGTGNWIGGLIGQFLTGTIIGCNAYGDTTGGTYVGGLIGENTAGAISNCNSIATVKGSSIVGGLIGSNGATGVVTNCEAHGQTDGTGDGVGGLVGENWGKITDCNSTGATTGNSFVGSSFGGSLGNIENCHSTGTTTGTGDAIGGFIGWNIDGGTVANCSSTGNTFGGNTTGGFVGFVENSTVTYCSSTGYTSGGVEYIGGFFGAAIYSSISNSNSTGDVDGQDGIGGFGGYNGVGSNITDCYSTGNASGSLGVGGFLGGNEGGNVTDCQGYGNAAATEDWAGGLIGQSILGMVVDCTAYGNANGIDRVGGLIGESSSSVDNCHSFGVVDGNNRIGGLIGFNTGGIANSTANATVTGAGERIGGLIGYNTVAITNCTSYGTTTQTVNADHVGGLIGYNGASTVKECRSYGTVIGFNALGASFVGGLIGTAIGLVENCDSYAQVNGFQQSGGLIGWNHAMVRNCTAHGYVDAWNSYAGGFMGQNDPGGWVENCTAYGNVDSGNDYTGGFTGSHEGAAIIGCTAYGDVTADSYVGGFVGRNVNGNRYITNCSAHGNTTGTYETGGFVGQNQAEIYNSTVHCNVSGNNRAGGFAGVNQLGTIKDCYSHANVDGDDIVGGFIGYMQSGIVNTSYSMGLVVGSTSVGGLVGSYLGGEVNDCFWDNETSNQITSVNGTGKSTIEMMIQTTFDPPWDFTNVWGIHEANTYPFLLAFGTPAPPSVNLSVSVEVSSTLTNTNETFYMWLNVTNNGLDNAVNVNVTVYDLTVGIADIDHDMGPSAFVWGTNGTWPVGTLLNGESAFAQLNMTVDNASAGLLFDYAANVTNDINETYWPDNNDTAQVQVNSPPNALDDAYTTNEDNILNVPAPGVLANDTDPDTGMGDTLTVDTFDNPSSLGAIVALNVDGSFSYDPTGVAAFLALAVGEYMVDTFDYTIIDTKGNTSTATVTINVTGVNAPPVANNDSATIAEDSGSNAIDVLANDTDPDATDIPFITLVTQGANGTVNITGGGTGLTYEPVANFTGTDTFTYNISDGNGGNATATVTVNVTPVNDPPMAVDDSATIAEDSNATAIDVLANDDDPDGDVLNITYVTQPANGTVNITGGGTGLTYEPDANFTGNDSFTYRISDGNTETATATVNVTVTGVNDPPIAEADTPTVDEDTGVNTIDVLTNDWDVDGDALTITAVTQAIHGAVVITGSGTALTYQPDADFFGLDVFTYTISDGTTTDIATVMMRVKNVNDLPEIMDMTAPPGIQGQFYELTLTASDIDLDVLTWSGVSDAFWLRVFADGVVNGTPGQAGTFWIHVTVNDGQGGTDDINLTITIDPDLDGDGIIDAIDDDRDGDGVANAEDLWPDNSAESADTDGDGVGDNADPDDDNDGIPDVDDENPFTYDEPGSGGIPTYLWIAVLLVAIGIGMALGYLWMGRSAGKPPKQKEDEPGADEEAEDELAVEEEPGLTDEAEVEPETAEPVASEEVEPKATEKPPSHGSEAEPEAKPEGSGLT